MKAIRKADSRNVPSNSVFNYLFAIDNKVQEKKQIVNKNEKGSITLVDKSTAKKKDSGVYSKMLEEDTGVQSDDTKKQVSKNDSKRKKWKIDDTAEKDIQDSLKEQASRNEQSEELERRRAVFRESGRSTQRRRQYREQSANEEDAETDSSSQPKKNKKVNFVMNSDGCFINGKPFDPNNSPDGIAIIVDQKSALSEKQLKKRK